MALVGSANIVGQRIVVSGGKITMSVPAYDALAVHVGAVSVGSGKRGLGLGMRQGVNQAGHSLKMSGSKPKFDAIFAARLARGNDPARKTALDALAALEEQPGERLGGGSLSRGDLPSSSAVGPPSGAQTENQASKHKTQSIGLDIHDGTSGTPGSSNASFLGGDGRVYAGASELPSGAGPQLSNSVALNPSLTPHAPYQSHSAPANRLPLASPLGSGSYGRTESGAPEPTWQPQPLSDFRPSKRRKISPTRRSASSRSSEGMVEVAAHRMTPKEGIDTGSPFSQSIAFSLNPAGAPGSSGRVSRPANGAAGASSSPRGYVQTSNMPVTISLQNPSNLEKMLGAGISPSDEMRRAFGHAVNNMLPNAEPRETARIAGIEDDELDGHIRQVAPILATAYSQLVNADNGSEHCAEKLYGPGDLPLPKGSAHGAPLMDNVQTEAIPSRVGTLESGISNLDKYLSTLESELQNAVSSCPPTSACVKDQGMSTVVLEFLGPPPLSSTRYTFEVTQPEAEAASRWNKRTASFDPQSDYLEYTLDARLAPNQTQERVHTQETIVGGMVMILLNGKEVAPLNPRSAQDVTAPLSRPSSVLEARPASEYPFKTGESSTAAQRLTQPNAVVIPSDDKLLDAVDRLGARIRRMEWLSQYDQQATMSPSQTVPGRSDHSWPEFAKKKKSRAMAKAQKEHESVPELAQVGDRKATTATSSRSQAIVQAMDENDVVFVQGETGSEMQTEVPQIILDHWTRLQKGADCNVVVVQSQGNAAATAEITSAQRPLTTSRQVGYEIEGRSDLPQPHGSITFCTPGVLLRSLQVDRHDRRRAKLTIEKASHIVVDNLQPRTTQLDLLLCFLKRAQAQRKLGGNPLKLIFTSSPSCLPTLRTYFAIPGEHPPPVISIPSPKSPKLRLYLEDLTENLQEETRVFLNGDAMDYLHRESTASATSPLSGSETKLETPPASAMTLGIWHALSSTRQGDVLVVLPGEEEVKDLYAALHKEFQALSHDRHLVIEVANKPRTPHNQNAARSSRRHAGRHIILATPSWLNNLHDSNVACVVDSVLTRRRRYDPSRRTTIVETVRATQAEVDARSASTGGRGTYIGMISRTSASRLRPLPEPEIGLSELSAAALTVAGTDLPGNSLDGVFVDLPDRPSTAAVAAAVGDLKRLGALGADGSLTSLGRILCQLPLKPSLGKMLICGAFLRCLDPAITIAAVMKRQANLFGGNLDGRRRFYHPQFPSDITAQYWAYAQWEELMQRGRITEATTFVKNNHLSLSALRQVEAEKAALFHALHGTGVMWPLKRGFDLPGYLHSSSLPAFNVNKSSQATISALIAVGLQPHFGLAQYGRPYSIYPSQAVMPIGKSIVDTQTMKSGSACVLAYRESFETATTSGRQVRLLNPSCVPSLAYILLGASTFQQQANKGVYVCDDRISIKGSPEFLDRLASLKGDLGRTLGWLYDKVFLQEAWKRHQEQRHRPVLPGEREASRSPMDKEPYPYQELDEVDQIMKNTVDLLDQAAGQ
ncbi:hypothetical protein FRC01_004798 [Tulasnella sp. 417]|nr:hypothetical protein FRC01_004798 [Tulasnella sp. 417]